MNEEVTPHTLYIELMSIDNGDINTMDEGPWTYTIAGNLFTISNPPVVVGTERNFIVDEDTYVVAWIDGDGGPAAPESITSIDDLMWARQ